MKQRRVFHELLKRFIDYFTPSKVTIWELIRRVLLLTCVVVFIFAGYPVVQKWYEDYVTERLYQQKDTPDLSQDNSGAGIFDHHEEDPTDFLPVDPAEGIRMSFPSFPTDDRMGNRLLSSGRIMGASYVRTHDNDNSDVVGYINIPNTQISYFVYQHRLDNYFYLTRTFDLRVTTAASIFMDFNNRPYAEDKNTILYGHNMRSGAMFANLHNYKNRDFAMENRYITFNTLYEDMVWEVFSVFLSDITRDFNYIQTSFRTDEDFEAFLQNCINSSRHRFEARPGVNDRILTLSTCDSRDSDRWVVQAMLVSRTRR